MDTQIIQKDIEAIYGPFVCLMIQGLNCLLLETIFKTV